jgi:nucleoid-associated protein YgaU
MPDILINRQYREYQRVSRYSPLPFYYNTQDEKYMYGTAVKLKKDVSYKVHTIEVGDTLDSLALYYYNNPTYFWIIADFNDIIDPYEELKVGEILKIPTFSTIEFDV